MNNFFPVYRKREVIVRKGAKNRVYTFDVMNYYYPNASVLVGYVVVNIDSDDSFTSVTFPEGSLEKEVLDELRVRCFNTAKDIEKMFEWFTGWGALIGHLKSIFIMYDNDICNKKVQATYILLNHKKKEWKICGKL